VPSGPARYNMFGALDERTITVTTSCSDVEFTTRIQSAWLAVFSDEDRRVSADGTSIAGNKEDARNSWTWSLTRQASDTP
jgi:hypothetical protein